MNHSKTLVLPTLLALALLCLPVAAIAQTAEEYYERGVSLYTRGDLAGAMIELQNALQQEREHLPARVLLGRVHMERNQPLDAENQLNLALRLGADPELVMPILGTAWLYQQKTEDIFADQRYRKFSPRSAALWLNLRGKAYLNLNQFPDAEKEYQESLRLDPGGVEGMTGLGLAYLVQNKREDALDMATRALAEAPSNDQALALMGDLANLEGNGDRALEYYDAAVKANPRNYSVRQKRIVLLVSRQDFAAAETDIDFVLEQYPNNPRALIAKAQLLAQQHRNQEAQQLLEEFNFRMSNIPDEVLNKDVNLQVIRALTLYMQGSYVQAIPYLKMVLENDPSKTYFRQMLLESYVANDQPEDAVALYRPVEMLASADVGDAYTYARAAWRAGLQDEAVSKLRAWARANPELARELSQLVAVTLITQDRTEEARSEIAGLQLEDVDIMSSLLLLGSIQLDEGQLDDARQTADKLLSLYPQEADALNFVCLTHKRMDELDKVIEFCGRAIELAPQNTAPVINLSVALMEHGRYLEAISGFNAVLSVFPADSRALEGLAYIARQQRDWKSGIRFAERLVAFYPDDIDHRLMLAEFYFEQGQDQDGMAQLDLVEKLSPANPQALALRTGALQQAGDTEAAAEGLRRLSELYRQDNPQALVRIAQQQLLIKNLDDAQVTINAIMEHRDSRNAGTALQAEHAYLKKDPARCVRLLAGLDPEQLTLQQQLLLTQCYTSSGRADSALALLDTLLSRRSDPELAIRRFHIQLLTGDAAAVPAMEAYTTRYPDRPAAIKALADYFAQTDPARALEYYKRLLSDWPDFAVAEVHNNLANLLLLTGGDSATALEYARVAFEADPRNANIADTLGWALVNNAQYEEGLKYLRQAFVRKSRDPEVLYHLAFALGKLGRKEEAVKFRGEIGPGWMSPAQSQALDSVLAESTP